MKFEFKINKYYLVGYAMTSKHKPFPAWGKLEERIWQEYKNEPAYYFLNPKYISLTLEKLQTDFTENNIKSVFIKQIKILEKIYKDIFKTKEFKRLYKETYKYLQFVKKQWQKNEKEALKILQEVSGLPIPKHKINVYITHPKSRNGKTLDKRTIICGHIEKWKNHITICLCHELLHIMTWPGHFQPYYNILHSLILLNDNELKIRLNKRGGYFKEKGFNTEPAEFLNLEKKILPYWKKYLEGKLGESIIEFKNLVKEKIKIK